MPHLQNIKNHVLKYSNKQVCFRKVLLCLKTSISHVVFGFEFPLSPQVTNGNATLKKEVARTTLYIANVVRASKLLIIF